MVDEVDRAEIELERELDRAIENAAGCVPEPGDGSEHCELCGDEMDSRRAALGYRRCLLCAQSAERFELTHRRR